jgi:hypothetical protein
MHTLRHTTHQEIDADTPCCRENGAASRRSTNGEKPKVAASDCLPKVTLLATMVKSVAGISTPRQPPPSAPPLTHPHPPPPPEAPPAFPEGSAYFMAVLFVWTKVVWDKWEAGGWSLSQILVSFTTIQRLSLYPPSPPQKQLQITTVEKLGWKN